RGHGRPRRCTDHNRFASARGAEVRGRCPSHRGRRRGRHCRAARCVRNRGWSVTEVVFVPSGRPVLRFVSVLGGLAVVLLALSWTGAIAPRVQLRVIRSTFDNPAQSGTVTLTVTNRGPAAAYVGRVTSGNPYVHVAPAGTARVRRIGGGTSERINFSYRFDCAGFAPSPELRIRV